MAAKKIAWITGGGTGIGLGGARVLASEGWTVVISGRRADVLNQVAKELGNNVEAVALDVGDAGKVEQAAAEILRAVSICWSTAPASTSPTAAGLISPRPPGTRWWISTSTA